MSSTLTVHDVCERFGVSEHTVLAWIRSGELRAIHVGRKAGAKKPRWRITQEALDAFEAIRTPHPPPPKTRRRKKPGEVIEFYK
jgi:excisionase family DNA binding protein